MNGFGWNLGHSWLRIYCLELALSDFGRDPRRSESEQKFCFFLSGKQRAISRTSSRPNFTKFAHNTWIYVAMNPFGKHLWKFTRKGSFSKKVNFCVNIVNDFRVPTSGRDICKINRAYKSLKVMTGWHAYGMLAFHLYHLNQLKAIPLACRAHTRSVLSNARSRVIYIFKNLTAEL